MPTLQRTFQPSPGRLPDGQRVYAVGDVHGCDDRLAALHAMIRDDLAARPVARATLVHLGDYVDRGADSRGVLARIAVAPASGLDVVNLRGNHEVMMLAALAGGAEDVADWRGNGAAETLASFGIAPGADPATWAGAVGPQTLEQLRSLRPHWQAGGYYFIHAGMRPGLPLASQSDADLLWIRGPFLDHEGDFGAVVVHGHTPVRRPQIRRNRIGIDTGAVMGGPLTCAVLEGDALGFLQA